MDTLASGALTVVSGLSDFATFGLIVLFVLLFKDEIATRFFGKQGKEEAIPEWADKLVNHFNHDTTDAQKRIEDNLEALQEKDNRIIQLLEEIQKYGITCRNK